MLAEETEVNVTNFTWSHRLVRFHEQVGLACYSHTTSGRNNGGRDQRELECRSGEGILITRETGDERRLLESQSRGFARQRGKKKQSHRYASRRNGGQRHKFYMVSSLGAVSRASRACVL
mmetsp:Transcript_24819/g.98087  ORF Transcript_24819/g.98087 Transcript_24819/m.98087 type:complete len:120 (-) Transcript_24819:84-443(-)